MATTVIIVACLLLGVIQRSLTSVDKEFGKTWLKNSNNKSFKSNLRSHRLLIFWRHRKKQGFSWFSFGRWHRFCVVSSFETRYIFRVYVFRFAIPSIFGLRQYLFMLTTPICTTAIPRKRYQLYTPSRGKPCFRQSSQRLPISQGAFLGWELEE